VEEILHQLIGSIRHNLQASAHPGWLFGISEPSINSITRKIPAKLEAKTSPNISGTQNGILTYFCKAYVNEHPPPKWLN